MDLFVKKYAKIPANTILGTTNYKSRFVGSFMQDTSIF